MQNGKRGVGKRRDSCQRGATSNMIDWYHIDGVVDIRNKA